MTTEVFQLVMDMRQNFLNRVRSGQPYLVWVWKISPKNPKFFNFFHWVKKISSSWVKKYPGQRWVGLLSTAGQKYARVRLGQGPSVRAHLMATQSI